MTGAQHRRERLAPPIGIGGRGGERADAAAAGEGDRGLPRRRRAASSRAGAASVLVDPGGPQRLAYAPRAIAAPAERGGARGGELAVVDIAERGASFDQRLDRCPGRGPLARPAALLDLAREIGAQLRARRRVAADISEREPLEERASSGLTLAAVRAVGCSFVQLGGTFAMFVPQSGRI